MYIDKRCRVRIYVGGEAVYIYTSLRGQVCARVIATPSHNNAPGQCRDTYSNSIALGTSSYVPYLLLLLSLAP